MATSATPLYSSLSSLSLSSSNRSNLVTSHSTAFFFSHLRPPFLHSSASSQTPGPYSLRANSGDINSFDEVNPEDEIVFNPPIKPEGYVPPRPVDEPPFESEDEIARAYEELYGPAYSGESALGNDVYVMDSKVKKADGFISNVDKEKPRDGFDERVVQVRRVTKVVKGGKQLRFRAIVVVGDKKGHVGVGHGKAREVVGAVEKAAADARRNIITIPMTKYLTFPHRSDGDFGAASVMLRPATPGTGVIAGGSVRIVLEMAGVENALGKQLGSNNALNNARATVMACLKMKQFSEVAEDRGIPMEELWK